MNNAARTDTAQQLTLLPDLAPPVVTNPRFTLSKDTRELGMRHVAEIRRLLADRKAAREAGNVVRLPARTGRAA